MSLYSLKPRFQNLLRPLVGQLHGYGFTANQITVMAWAGSVALGVFMAVAALNPEHGNWPFLLLPVWMLARMALNAIDGMLAREHGQASPLGGYLNELCDAVSDAALYLPFALLHPSFLWPVLAVIWLSALVEMAGILGFAANGIRQYSGPMGKSDRAFAFGTLGLVAAAGGSLPGWLAWAFAGIAALLLLSLVNRVKAGLR